MLSTDALIALMALALASTWTPGPNNMMLAASGATFGYRATLGHAFGVALGFPLMVFVLALGLGEAFGQSGRLREGLRWAGVAILLWLAWRIGTASRAKAAAGRARPLSFLQAAGFQWVNPKAWMMAVSIPAAFVTGLHPAREAAICAGAFLLSGLGSSQAWAGFGAVLRRWLADDRRLRLFNAVMGLSVAASAGYLAIVDLH